MRKEISLALFVLLVCGGGLLIGYLMAPGPWYAGLAKPSFTPPNWLFAPVWTALYLMIAFAGWRIWRSHRRSAAMKLWWAQLLLNFLWSPAFFGAHRMGLALAIILMLLVAIVAFIAASWRRDRTAALLLLPYLIWVAFASALNGAIYWIN